MLSTEPSTAESAGSRLAGRTAMVTGAGAGIARATALMFAREGARVLVAEIDAATGAATARSIEAAGGQALFVRTDVSDEASVQHAVAAAVERFGAVDVLFNSAGGPLAEDGYVTDVDMKVWDRITNVDLKGTMLCCRHVIPHMIASGRGAIVNMSSGAALRGSSNSHVYTAAKGAILSLTRALAGAYARDGIRANALCAGRVMTERTIRKYGLAGQPAEVVDRQDGAGRVREYPFWMGKPDDIANIAVFLASDESRMITGAAIPADGGRSAY